LTEGGSRARLYLLILTMVASWAASFPVGKLALRELPQLFLPGVRVTIAAALMGAIFVWWRRRNPSAPLWSRGDAARIGALALLGVALNQFLFVAGLKRTSVAHASLIIAISPVMVWLGSVAKGYERFRPARILGIALAIAGVVVLQVLPARNTGASLTGDFLVFLSISFFAVYSVLSREVSRRIGSVPLNTLLYAVSAVVMLPVALWDARGLDLGRVSPSTWIYVVLLAAFPSVLAYLIFSHAIARIAPSRVSMFSYLQPFLATMLAVPILQEPVTMSFFAGGALVLGGVYLAERTA
jgi:drug/metabolite transporter (DMT)-like permease